MTDYHRIAAGSPMGQAARQMGRGEESGPRGNAPEALFETCPPLKPVARDQRDLTGRVLGRLETVGVWDPPPGRLNGNSTARWVCRCRCGVYVLRKARVIEQGHGQACYVCYRVLRMRGEVP